MVLVEVDPGGGVNGRPRLEVEYDWNFSMVLGSVSVPWELGGSAVPVICL